MKLSEITRRAAALTATESGDVTPEDVSLARTLADAAAHVESAHDSVRHLMLDHHTHFTTTDGEKLQAIERALTDCAVLFRHFEWDELLFGGD